MEIRCKKSLVVSIVSHGHGKDIQRLLKQLAAQSAAYVARVVITHNVPEPSLIEPAEGWPFTVEIVHNSFPRGFGSNHNRALKDAQEAFVCVLNPDVELIKDEEPFAGLIQAASQSYIGCSYPVQIDSDGRIQDSEREIPTPMALWRRHFLNHTEKRVDWVNAACIVLPGHVWHAVNGFDESYFMYCEDVDLCLRLRLNGLKLLKTSEKVIHPGRRSSHRKLMHLLWHMRSLYNLWTGLVYKNARELCKRGI